MGKNADENSSLRALWTEHGNKWLPLATKGQSWKKKAMLDHCLGTGIQKEERVRSWRGTREGHASNRAASVLNVEACLKDERLDRGRKRVGGKGHQEEKRRDIVMCICIECSSIEGS